MHAKPDLRVEFEPDDHFFRLGDLCRYTTLGNAIGETFFVLRVFGIGISEGIQPTPQAGHLETWSKIVQTTMATTCCISQRIDFLPNHQSAPNNNGREKTPTDGTGTVAIQAYTTRITMR